jgi:malonate transporter
MRRTPQETFAMIVALGLIAPFFLYILAGVAAQLLLRHGAEQQRWLDAFIFYVALPALLFQSVRVVPPSDNNLIGFLAITICVTGAMFCLGWLIGRKGGSGERVLSRTFAIFRLLADFATWFSNKQATGCIGCRLISREPIILKA